MSSADVGFAKPDVLIYTKLALPKGPKPGFICDVVNPTTVVVKDVRGKEPVDVLKVSDDGTGRYVTTRISEDSRYSHWYNVVADNVSYAQQETPGSTPHLGL